MASREKKFVPMRMPAKKAVKQAADSSQQEFAGETANANRGEAQQIKARQVQNKAKGAAFEGMAAAEQQGIEFQGKTDKSSLAMELLKDGHVQSFIDFFKITNSNQKGDDPEREAFLESLTQDKLRELQRSLREAEENSKYPKKEPAIQGYYALAEKFFDHYQQYEDAAYFYKRVIQLAKHSEDDMWVGKGKLGYAKCQDKLKKIGDAIEILEKSLQDVERNNPQSHIAELISQELIQIYLKVAQQYEKGEVDNIQNALFYYEKCLEVARKLDKGSEESSICYKIGLLYFKSGNYQRAIDFQQKYLELAKSIPGEEGKQKTMEGHAALAKCYLRLNMNNEAQEQLEKYMEFAEKLRQQNSVSDAALHLAALWEQKNNKKKALEFYKTHFDGARTAKEKDRKIVDKARVIYGIAKANYEIEEHIQRVKNSDKDLKTLLDWKQQKKGNQ